MRRLSLLLAVSLVVACAPAPADETGTGSAAPPVNRAADEEALRAAITNRASAIVREDTAAVANFYATGALLLPPGGQALGGRPGVTKGWNAVFATPGLSLRFASTTVTMSDAGDFAYDVGTWRGTHATGQESLGKYLAVWRKQDGAWRLTADMWNADGAGR